MSQLAALSVALYVFLSRGYISGACFYFIVLVLKFIQRFFQVFIHCSVYTVKLN